jgi:hypothetical protein
MLKGDVQGAESLLKFKNENRNEIKNRAIPETAYSELARRTLQTDKTFRPPHLHHPAAIFDHE